MSGCGEGGCGSCGCCGDEPEEYQVWAGLDRIPAFEVVGVSRVISGGEGAAEEISALWEMFIKEHSSKIEIHQDDVVYAVYSDYAGDHTQSYRLTVGYRVFEDTDITVSEGMYCVEVIEDEYGLVNTRGKQPEALMDAWTSIWESDLDRCFKTDFEVYSPNFYEEGLHEALVAVGVKVPPMEEGAEEE